MKSYKKSVNVRWKMNNKLEKTFFDTFGIKPKTIIEPRYSLNTEYYEEKIEKYPQITDRILLELIRLGLNYDFVIHSKSKDELKEKLLILLIRNDVEFKHQVHTLFEEEN